MKQVESPPHWNQQATSCSSPECLLYQIQVQQLTLVVATDRSRLLLKKDAVYYWENTKYLTGCSIRVNFVKKTSIPNPVESLGYIKCYSLSSSRPIKSPSNFMQLSKDLQLFEKTWNHTGNQKKRLHFSWW